METAVYLITLLFLHDMNGKSAEFSIQIDVLDFSVFRVGSRVHIEGEALLFQFFYGGGQICSPHGNVAVGSEERCLHALKIGTCKFSFV